MSNLTDDAIATIARNAGFTGTALHIAIAVCLAESAGNPDAVNTYHNTPPSRDRGLWQINSYWHPEVSDAAAFNPASNAAAAYRISNHGNDWSPWSTYVNGSYRRYLNRAAAAVEHLTPNHPTTYLLRRTLTSGCVGDDVKHLQSALRCTVDGMFGPLTRQAVTAFQRQHGLAVDGIIGPQTCHALGWAWE